MTAPVALLDTNVVVAMFVEEHIHHAASFALVESVVPRNLCVAAHSYAEAFATLTRQGERAPFRWPADEAWAALESIAAITKLVGLTPAQSFDAVRAYAAAGGIGARLYDRLIGQAAAIAGAGAIVTWNVGHMRSLFPELEVRTPAEFMDFDLSRFSTRR